MTNQYRKKPVVIEAIQYDGDNWDDIEVWTDFRAKHWRSSNVMAIETLEGTMTANVGDWIIKGVAGEFYPCKPDIFKATYEEINQKGKNMPIITEVTLTCVKCGHWDGFTSQSKDALHTLLANGWVQLLNGEFLCPDCAEKQKQKPYTVSITPLTTLQFCGKIILEN